MSTLKEPDYFCKKCKKPARIIKEKYLSPIIETRIWDDVNTYELQSSNFDENEYVTYCGVCGTEIDTTNER